MFLPKPDGRRHPAVLLLGGSEGGLGAVYSAALLASHGYPTLTAAYFHYPGLPATLKNIPLEYFASAARLLAAQPGVDPAHLLTWGGSRGAEAALLTVAALGGTRAIDATAQADAWPQVLSLLRSLDR